MWHYRRWIILLCVSASSLEAKGTSNSPQLRSVVDHKQELHAEVHRRLFDVDGFTDAAGGQTYPEFSLTTFSSSNTAGTTRIYQFYQDPIPAGTNITCSLWAQYSSSGTSHLRIKFGSVFQSITDGEGVSGDSANNEELIFSAVAPSTESGYVMAYSSDGTIVNGYIRCDTDDLPNTDASEYPNAHDQSSEKFFLDTYNAGNVADTTHMEFLGWGTELWPPVGTPVTCEVVCDSGAGIARMKLGRFTSIDEGTASSSTDQECPFSVTVPYEDYTNHYLLVYSLTSDIFNGDVICTHPTPTPTPAPTFFSPSPINIPPSADNGPLTPAPYAAEDSSCFQDGKSSGWWKQTLEFLEEKSKGLGFVWN